MPKILSISLFIAVAFGVNLHAEMVRDELTRNTAVSPILLGQFTGPIADPILQPEEASFLAASSAEENALAQSALGSAQAPSGDIGSQEDSGLNGGTAQLQLGATPEPGSWVLALAGLGLIAAAKLRSTRVKSDQ